MVIVPYKHTMVGLVNIGNTCYLNSLLQCFRFVSKVKNSLECPSNGPIAKAWAQLYKEMEEGKSAIMPLTFLRLVSDVLSSQGLRINAQNDIHEVYLHIINKILAQSTMPTFDSTTGVAAAAATTAASAYDRLASFCDDSWRKYFSKENCSLVDTLYGQLISQIRCESCSHIHHNYEPFPCLELPLTQPGESIQTLLQNLCHDELVSDWICSECKRSVPSKKTVAFWKLPPILVLSLKRFQQLNGSFVKNSVATTIEETITIETLKDVYDGDSTYRLRSMAMHRGTVTGGHYYALSRVEDKWFHFDDENVVVLNDTVSSCEAYLLIYERF
jgi:ubiquitin C-terminal hydrolase